MLNGGTQGFEVEVEEMSTKERATYLARQCLWRATGQGEGGNMNGRENNVKESLPLEGEVAEQEREDKDSKGNVLFLMKAGGATKETGAGESSNKGQRDVLVCAPPHSAAKAVFEQINQQVLLLNTEY